MTKISIFMQLLAILIGTEGTTFLSNYDQFDEATRRSQESSNNWFMNAGIHTIYQTPALHRLRRKILGGHSVTMVTIGGSNSAGGGVDNLAEIYSNQLADWWNIAVYNKTGSRMTSYNLAIGGTGSDFFLFCFQNFLLQEAHLPDIVLVELAVNDLHIRSEYGKAAVPMELLTRRLLLLPSTPLVIYVDLINPNIVNGKIRNTGCVSMEDYGFNELARNYGIPVFSIRDIVCPLDSDNKRKLGNSKIDMFSRDNNHVGYRTHTLLASLMMKYFIKVIHEIPPKVSLWPLKAKQLFSSSSISNKQITDMKCFSYLLPNWKVPLQQTLHAQVVRFDNFNYRSPFEGRWLGKMRTDASGGWFANPGLVHLEVQFYIPSSQSESSTLHSVVVLLKYNENLPLSLKIWLNDANRSCTQMVILSDGPGRAINQVFPVTGEALPGNYTLTIQGHVKYLHFLGMAVGYPGFYGYQGYKDINGAIGICNWNVNTDQQIHYMVS